MPPSRARARERETPAGASRWKRNPYERWSFPSEGLPRIHTRTAAYRSSSRYPIGQAEAAAAPRGVVIDSHRRSGLGEDNLTIDRTMPRTLGGFALAVAL